VREHELKTWPSPFNSMLAGVKRFEFRKNDRDFKVGDILSLREWDPKTETFMGGRLRRRVQYIIHGGVFGIPEGYCIMDLTDVRAPCCACGYDEDEETPCPNSIDGQHCRCWYDGPAEGHSDGR